jgi:hypothetical protein
MFPFCIAVTVDGVQQVGSFLAKQQQEKRQTEE